MGKMFTIKSFLCVIKALGDFAFVGLGFRRPVLL